MPHITKLFRAAKGRPAAIHTIFDTLLWTADLQAHRGKVPLPPGVGNWPGLPPEWTLEKLEAKYGIGHYEDRKILLHDALNALLKKGVEVEPVYRSLYTAQHTMAAWYEIQNAFQAARMIEDERYMVETNLQKWADRLQHLDRARTTMSAPALVQALRHKQRPTLPRLAPPLVLAPRPRRGPLSPKALMRPMLKALTAAGVTGWVRSTLLEVTGLTT